MQDEHEREKNGVGVAPLGAGADAECRKPAPGANPGGFGSSEPIEFASSGRQERNSWVERLLAAQRYGPLGKGKRA
jgi:hypothetical protein